tara:strand:- start:384 stop:683 length:300 start_codon:yes stop_codon:yes gene_type:complete
MSDIKTEIESFITNEAQPMINGYYPSLPILSVSYGRKYAKIMSGTSVWAFIALTDDLFKNEVIGDMLKPASWRTPAKHSRGNILNGTASYGVYGPSYLN